MHAQRRYLSLAILLTCSAYFLHWLTLPNIYWTGLYFGYIGLLSLIVYAIILVIVLIDISDRPLSKQRLITIGLVTLTTSLCFLKKVYTVFSRFRPHEQTLEVVDIGLVLFICANLFILIYVAYSYKNDYILPEVDESVLDSDLK